MLGTQHVPTKCLLLLFVSSLLIRHGAQKPPVGPHCLKTESKLLSLTCKDSPELAQTCLPRLTLHTPRRYTAITLTPELSLWVLTSQKEFTESMMSVRPQAVS